MKKIDVVLNTEWNNENGGAEFVNSTIKSIFSEEVFVRSIWSDYPNLGTVHESWLKFLRFLPKSLLGILTLPEQLVRKSHKADILINSSFIFAHLFKSKKKNYLQINYVHTPLRYVWNSEIDSRILNFGVFSKIIIAFLKYVDCRFLNRDALYIANSKEVQSRIMKFWGVNSIVVYPPVDIDFFGSFFRESAPGQPTLISAGRLVEYKNHIMAIEISKAANIPLVIAGYGEQERELREFANRIHADVTFVISPSRSKLAELISNSSIFLHLAHEDFGILPVEAMATGTPVLGINRGGLLETVSDKSGFLTDNFDSLISAIPFCLSLNRKQVAETVMDFSVLNFQKKLAKLILDHRPDAIGTISRAYLP